jgi:hypothetical protein
MTEDVDELLFDDDNNTAENEEAIETEEDKIKRLRGELEKCLNGSDLYNYCIVHLPITGMKFGVSLSMNRAIAYLKNSKIIDDKTPTWANCKKNHKEIISSKFDEFLEKSIVIPLLCSGGGLISREVSRRGAALSPIVIICLHFETVTFRNSVSSVSMIVDDTIRGKDLLLFWLTFPEEFVPEFCLYSWSYGFGFEPL